MHVLQTDINQFFNRTTKIQFICHVSLWPAVAVSRAYVIGKNLQCCQKN